MTTVVRPPAQRPNSGGSAGRTPAAAPGRGGATRATGRASAAPLRGAPPGRGTRPRRPLHPAGPPRPAGPGRSALPGRPGPAARTAAPGAAQRRMLSGRTPFIVLVLAMLGGGLVCLLMINTTLAASSFRISYLQQANSALTQREQALQQQLAEQESPAALGREAFKLGLRPAEVLSFINVRTSRISTQPRTLPGVPLVPGYTP